MPNPADYTATRSYKNDRTVRQAQPPPARNTGHFRKIQCGPEARPHPAGMPKRNSPEPSPDTNIGKMVGFGLSLFSFGELDGAIP